MFPIYDLTSDGDRAGLEARLAGLRGAADPDGKWATLAGELIRDTRERGDTAIVEHMRQFTDPDYAAERMRVSAEELAAAEAQLTGPLREAIEQAIKNVYAYQQHIKPTDADPVTIAGAELGLRWTPITPVGLLVPGGSAVLFSSLIMLAVPAMVAGVKPEDIDLIATALKQTHGKVHPRTVWPESFLDAEGDWLPKPKGVVHSSCLVFHSSGG